MADIPGHACNAYCRPGEGLHCLVDHLWVPAGSTMTVDDALYWYSSCPVWIDGMSYDAVEMRPAPEVPPNTRADQAAAVRRNQGHALHARDLRHCRHVGAILTTFRAPVMVGVLP